MINFPL